MTPDVLPSPPRKASWKRWIVVSAGVLAITLAVLFLKAPAPEPVSVRFVGSTDDNGKRVLRFKGTNGLPRGIAYWAHVSLTLSNGTQTAAVTSPPQSPDRQFRRGLDPYLPSVCVASPRETFTFSLEVPPKGTNWQVVWSFSDPDHIPTRWENLRWRCADFLASHKLTWLAVRIQPVDVFYYTPWTETKE